MSIITQLTSALNRKKVSSISQLKKYIKQILKFYILNYHKRGRYSTILDKGWYCYITDSRIHAKHTVLTLHGAPGDHVEWAALQTEMNDTCRWVNLTTPGFDGEDQRRGDYNGSAADFSELILRLLKYLKVSKVIVCAHSLGSIFCSYFISKYLGVVQGYVNITGIVDMWYTGLMTFFQTVVTNYGYNNQEWRRQKLWDDDHQRIILHHKFLQSAEGRFFGPVQFPKLTITQFFGYFKLINTLPNGLSQLYQLNRDLQIFRVLIFGKKDPLHEVAKTQASIYHLCHSEKSYINRPSFKKLFTTIKSSVQKRLRDEFSVQIDGSKLQQYFCYHFLDTGHNAHKRRPVQISRIIKIYMACLEVIEQYTIVNGTNL